MIDGILSTSKEMFGSTSELAEGVPTYLDGDVQEGSAAMLFGDRSELVVGEVGVYSADSLVEQPLFQGVMLLTLLYYLMVMLRSWGFMGIVWGGQKNSIGRERMESEGGKLQTSRFNAMITLLGVIMVAMGGVKIVDMALPRGAMLLSDTEMLIAPLVALLVMGVIVAWLYAMHTIVGWLSGSGVVGEVATLSSVNFVRGTVVLYPVVAAWLLSPAESASTWSAVAIVLGAIIVLIYFVESLQLFINKKVPILYWILYLCAVVVLPISFVARLLAT